MFAFGFLGAAKFNYDLVGQQLAMQPLDLNLLTMPDLPGGLFYVKSGDICPGDNGKCEKPKQCQRDRNNP